MVEFLFTEGNNSVDNEEQSSEYFYDVSTSSMLNNVTSLSGDKVSFMRAKTTSNILQCLQNELQQTLNLYV